MHNRHGRGLTHRMSIGTVGQSAKLNFSEKDPEAEQNRGDTQHMTNDRHLRIHAAGTFQSLEALQEMYGYPGGANPATALLCQQGPLRQSAAPQPLWSEGTVTFTCFDSRLDLSRANRMGPL